MPLDLPVPGVTRDWGEPINAALTELDERAVDLETAVEGLAPIGDVTALDARLDVAEAALDTEAAARTAADALLVPLTQKGAASGVAPLDAGSRVPEVNLPAHLAQSVQQATYARADLTSHEARKDDIRRSKGAVVGTNGKPVVSFRIDHGVQQFIDTIWPLFKARGIPCSLGVVTDAVENASDPYEPTTTTWATLLAEHRKGFEIWSHSRSHLDLPTTGHSLTDEVIGSRQELEAQGFKVFGWQLPGIPGCTTPDYSNNWVGNWGSVYGQMVSGNYGLIEQNGIVGGAARVLPTNGNYDHGHYTLDSMNAATAQSTLDGLLNFGLSSQWMLHPKFIVGGTVTCTTADVTTFLDYVKTLWDAGTIEVLTGSGLAFADPGTSRRLDLIRDGGFEAATTIPSSNGNPWQYAGGAGTGITVPTDGGHSGSKYLHLPASASFTYVYQGNTQIQNLRANGATFLAEVWARCTVANTEARITLQDPNDTTRLNYEYYTNLTAGSGWQRLRVPFSIPLATTNLQTRLSRRSGTGDIDFDDLRVVAV